MREIIQASAILPIGAFDSFGEGWMNGIRNQVYDHPEMDRDEPITATLWFLRSEQRPELEHPGWAACRREDAEFAAYSVRASSIKEM